MARLDLTKYTDEEIFEALIELPISKLNVVLQAVAAWSQKATARGQLLGQRHENRELFRRLESGDGEEEIS